MPYRIVEYDTSSGKKRAVLDEASLEKIANKNLANGYAGLNEDGKIARSQIQEVIGLSDLTDVADVTGATKGDILVKGEGTEFTRLPVGNDGQVLVADSTQTTGLKWSSISIGEAYFTGTVGEAVTEGDVLYFDTTASKYKKAKADSESTMPAVAIALEPGDEDATIKMTQVGNVTVNNGGTNLTPGSPVFVSATTAGVATTTPPTDSGNVQQRIGFAIGADKMIALVDTEYITV